MITLYHSVLGSHELYQSIGTNSSNNSTDTLNGCNAILFNLGDFSRYGPNATVVYGVCPDTWMTFSFSIALMFFSTILFILTCLGLWWKRKSRHIQSRGVIYMLLTLFASTFIVFSSSLRYTIGRREYPCFIYAVTYFVLPPALILPAIFRCYRLFMLHLLNLRKMNMLVDKSTLNLESLAHKTNKKDLVSTNNTSLNAHTTTVENFQNMTIETNGQNTVSNDAFNATPISPVSTTSVDSSTALNISEQVDNGSIPNNTSPRAFLKKKTASNFSLKMVEFDVSALSIAVADDDIKSYTISDSESANRERFDNQMKRAKFLNFLVSNIFILVAYLIIFSLHVIFFLIVGGIEWDQKLKKGTTIFTNDGGLFTVERGCGITNATFILVGVEAFCYIVVEVILIILCIIADRDTWNMRKEALVLVVLKLLSVISFVSCAFIPVFGKLLDFFIPYGNILLIYSITDVIISITLPIIYAWISDKKHVEWNQNSGLEQCLANKKTFAILLDFSRRSYCPESILCYKDVERLTQSRAKNRKKLAIHIQKTYLTKGSPLELNHPRLEEVYDEVKDLIDSNVDVVPFFRKIQCHCLNDMVDIFERVKKQDPEVRKIVEEWQAIYQTSTTVHNLNYKPSDI